MGISAVFFGLNCACAGLMVSLGGPFNCAIAGLNIGGATLMLLDIVVQKITAASPRKERG